MFVVPSKLDLKLNDSADAMLDNPSIVFVLLLNRLEFIRERDSAMASYSLNETRAQLCELLATKLLRHRAAGAANSTLGLLEMSKALVGGFHAFQGASAEVRTFPLFCVLVAQFTRQQVVERVRQKEGFTAGMVEGGAGELNALELAILGEARYFIKSQVSRPVHRRSPVSN